MDKKTILQDYKIVCESRQTSLIGHKDVMAGKAKFGIFGDGKELPQVAMAKVFKNGDFRSGYYRDQTFMLAIKELTITQFFAQLYGHANIQYDPASGGRMMNSHFGTRMVDDNGKFKDLVKHKNSTSDISPTASQMPRLLGLAYASKLFRNNKTLKSLRSFSNNGNEIAFGTIGDASTSEGIFFETINAAGVLQVPMIISIWDDGYGISVPTKYQTTKGSISTVLEGFRRTKTQNGIEIFSVCGWNYCHLIKTYSKAEKLAREKHVPVVIHVKELTQPQGHSTSGSHQRYKSAKILKWEQEFDCNKKFKKWIINNNIATQDELEQIENLALKNVSLCKDQAWKNLELEIESEKQNVIKLLEDNYRYESPLLNTLRNNVYIHRYKILETVYDFLDSTNLHHDNRKNILGYLNNIKKKYKNLYTSHLHSEGENSALNVKAVFPKYKAITDGLITQKPSAKKNKQEDLETETFSKARKSKNKEECINEDAQSNTLTQKEEETRLSYNNKENLYLEGREIIRKCFDNLLEKDPKIFFLGEDIGKIGGVNQGLANLQKKYGESRITDTGIREYTIVGQGIGAAIRGLRPIIEIQYLDYLPYAIQIISDDLATLRYRTVGGQICPLIIRTRGHRLEGIWHSGSYLASIIHAVRGVYVLVPRNFVQATGFYNTMAKSDDPAIIIECLNAYRLKEKVPENICDITIPIGKPEILKYGQHITLVTYGAMCNIVLDAASHLENIGISCEVIDVQTLLPYDIDKTIVESLKKTNKIAFIDEDLPGGTTSYMMQKTLIEHHGYDFLDTKPVTIASTQNRPAYGDDGNYFCKPNKRNIIDAVLEFS